MLRALYTGASGMRAQEMNLDNVANNLANSSTAGFSAAQLDKRRAGKLATAIQTAFNSTDRYRQNQPKSGVWPSMGFPPCCPWETLSRTTSTCCVNRWKTRYQEKLPVEKSLCASLTRAW